MEIKIDDLCGSEIAEFLEEHIREMKSVSPPESKQALDLSGLRKPEITFWTVWDEGCLIGCGAIKKLDADHAEIKSMLSVCLISRERRCLNATSAHFKRSEATRLSTYQSGNWLNAVFCSGTQFIYQIRL